MNTAKPDSSPTTETSLTQEPNQLAMSESSLCAQSIAFIGEYTPTFPAIRHARENNVPCLGTCGGFQHMIIEYDRNVLGFQDVQHAEYDPYASNLFISQLTCPLAGRTMQLAFGPSSRVAAIYNAIKAEEEYYCNFGINPDYSDALKQGPMPKVTSGSSNGPVIGSLSARYLCRKHGQHRHNPILWCRLF